MKTYPQAEVMRRADVNRLYDEKVNNSRRRRQPEGKQPEKKKRQSKIRRPLLERGMGLDLPFLLLVLVLVIIGMIMMFSASYPSAYYKLNDSYFYVRRQLIYAAIGLAAMIGISFFNYNKLHKLAPLLLGFAYLTLVIVLFLPGKVHRWIEIGPINIQASEIMKFALILFFAHWGSLYYDKMQSAKYSVLPGIIGFRLNGGAAYP